MNNKNIKIAILVGLLLNSFPELAIICLERHGKVKMFSCFELVEPRELCFH